ncbi:RNA-binding protein [Rothia sp. ZJ1223]|uniref:RNA-binding protein n=1 Tax=Rothia sp. ZJ1223 TaxID=2811098 RepID=UPI00195CC0B7|nr:RNA-binding protein [Rothia sp. ZJ1223]MBM7051409.1 RNA-binding protein [Rothia sp. ZJ1223]
MAVAKYGLNHPEDLAAWYEWSQQSNVKQRVRGILSNIPTVIEGLLGVGGASEAPESIAGYLHVRGSNPQILVVLDTTAPTTISALIEPTHHMDFADIAVWAPTDVSNFLSAGEWRTSIALESEVSKLTSVKAILSTGHYMQYGAAAYRYARAMGTEFVVVQHGLMTPYAPPLPANSTLLAFTDADARFWISGRSDISYRVVGSQLFYDAAQAAAGEQKVNISRQPIFLGQMHGAELPRASYAKAGYTFCKENNARYRPHPQEKDKLSVLTHRLWAKMGVEIDEGLEPFKNLNNPVVSVFSTGVLEAAIRGVPAWVYHPNPPAWLEEFWDRYGMNRWGSEPTPAPSIPSQEPAQAIAQYIKERLS